MPSRRSLSAATGVVAALALSAGVVTLLPGAGAVAEAEELAPYQSCEQLLESYRDELARTATAWGPGGGRRASSDVLLSLNSASGDRPMPAGALEQSGFKVDALTAEASGPTGTNVQERGVDEPDFVKMVDGLLLSVAQDRLQVIRAGAQPEQLASLKLDLTTTPGWPSASELLVEGDRVLVLTPQGGYGGHGGFGGPAGIWRGPWGGGGPTTTSAVLIDLADPGEPRILESLELSGRYLSARLSDGAVRLVTSTMAETAAVQPAAPYGPKQQKTALELNVKAARAVSLSDVLPRQTRRTPAGLVVDQGPAVDCEQVRHAKGAPGASTLLVTTLDLTKGLEAQDRTAVTTDGDLVYASPDRLYVATSRWGTTAPPMPVDVPDDRSSDTSTATVDTEEPTVTTELHGFDTTDPGRTTYVGSGSVDGYVLGRWALSSYDGHLRVATTSAPPWAGGQPQSESSLTVLAEREGDLVQTGRVDGMGKGEQIYAVRYFGELATVVTFRQTDPLYVLDLGDPQKPTLLGELKVPGFSTYLHPVGDDQLLGVGMSADNNGRVTGMQAQLFDLSDLTRPRSAAVLPLGRNAYSPIDNDSRAFNYDPVRRLAMVPMTQWGGTGAGNSAVGIRVGSDGTLEQVGRLEVKGWQVERSLSDDDHIYAVTRDGVVAGDPDELSRTGALTFER